MNNDHFRTLSTISVQRGMGECIGKMREELRKLDPPITGTDDPRIKVCNNIMLATGGVIHGRQLIFDPQALEEYCATFEAEMKASQTMRILETTIGGCSNHYAMIGMYRLPTRLLTIAERELDRDQGLLTRRMTKGQYFVEKGDLFDHRDITHYDDETGALIPSVASQEIIVPQRRDYLTVAKHALTYAPGKIAREHALSTIVIRAIDGFIESNARISLIRKGLISDREHDHQNVRDLHEAVTVDFSQGRFWPQDFSGQHRKTLAEAMGICGYISDEEMARKLMENLARMQNEEGRFLENKD